MLTAGPEHLPRSTVAEVPLRARARIRLPPRSEYRFGLPDPLTALGERLAIHIQVPTWRGPTRRS